MSKEIENKECEVCDSHYRLAYELDKTSGFSKFCPFCGADAIEEEDEDYEKDDE